MHYPIGLHTTEINHRISAVDVTSGLAPYWLFCEVMGVYSLLGVKEKNRSGHEGPLWSVLILTSASLSYLNCLKSDYFVVL